MWFWIFVIGGIILYAIANSGKEKSKPNIRYSYKVSEPNYNTEYSFKPAKPSALPENDPVIDALRGYIEAGWEIKIRYCNSSGTTTSRRIKPLEILVWNGQYYLKAVCLLREEERTFKIKRILAINDESIEKKRETKAQFIRSRVLLVEKNEEILASCKSFLRKNRISTSTAQDGISALDKAEKGNFDLIFLSQNIPYVSGIEVLRNIKKRGLTGAKVVMVTTKPDAKIKEEAERLGVSDYFVFSDDSKEELTSALEYFLSQ